MCGSKLGAFQKCGSEQKLRQNCGNEQKWMYYESGTNVAEHSELADTDRDREADLGKC